MIKSGLFKKNGFYCFFSKFSLFAAPCEEEEEEEEPYWTGLCAKGNKSRLNRFLDLMERVMRFSNLFSTILTLTVQLCSDQLYLIRRSLSTVILSPFHCLSVFSVSLLYFLDCFTFSQQPFRLFFFQTYKT